MHRPEFADNKPDGRVGSCQDCHMRDVAGKGADPAQFPGVPTCQDLPLHDMTGANTWVPYVLATASPGQYTDSLGPGLVEWLPFQNGGTLTATGGSSMFVDDFTSATSGGPPPEGLRF